MSYLTLGAGPNGGVLKDQRAEALKRLARFRQLPGYGPAMLRKYKELLPGPVYRAELQRLRNLEDRALTGNPKAFAYVQLRRAYEDDDIPAIRKWQSAVENAGGRAYLRAVAARSASYRARGIGMDGVG